MSVLGKPVVRAAVYTRKSSDEGLDQEFNSLDAQHEACSAYIASQRHEGWKLIKKRFDDGGISGGTLETYAFPVIGNMSVKEINSSHILRILSPIWVTKAETAKRVRQRLSTVFKYCFIPRKTQSR